ncbi:hypothetical protein EG329_013381 [Mollisiaceae sp. DMI_Dod_QoI]|nr:hypothetical protein EG329_013381 [Helotiales sp. DMI_Dod_QoI]
MPPKPAAPKLTHFLCIPLVTSTSRPQLQKSLTTFRENVSKRKTLGLPDGLPEKTIRPLGTLHLTLGVMSLLTPEKVDGALRLLNELDINEMLAAPSPVKFASNPLSHEKNELSESAAAERGDKKLGSGKGEASTLEPLKVTLRGLTSMHKASQTSILYSSPLDPDLRLYQFCQRLRDIFMKAEFIMEDKKALLLHATILNTVYARGGRGKGTGHGKTRRAKILIDARGILEEYEEFEFMNDVKVEKVAICRMGAKVDEDGEERYEVEGEIEVPEA